MQDPRKRTLGIIAALLIASLFAHAYTWTIISLCTGLFLVLLLVSKRGGYSRRAILFALIVVAVSGVNDISKSLATSSPSGIFQDVGRSRALMGPGQFAQR